MGKNKEKTSAETVIQDVLGIKKKENVLIIANPETNLIAQELYTAVREADGNPSLIFQPAKTIFDNAELPVIGAIKSEPDIVLSISSNKLGKDSEGIKNPYKTEDGRSYDHIFDYLLDGKKSIRACWTPGLTEDMFRRTVNIDYKLLRERCEAICKKYENAVSVHVTSPGGTDVVVPVKGRKGLVDNGDFTQPGSGGNVPAGEVFISPVVGKGNQGLLHKKARADSEADINERGTNGTIVFDGSMTFSDGDALLKTPITVQVTDGFVSDISGGEEAARLRKDILWAEKESLAMELSRKLPKGQGAVYARNARNIGELGIGLNPSANVTGNMLEDEKAFRTCHFAIGENYDGDASALIHFDGIVREPTLVIKYADGSEFTLLDKGDLQL